VAIRLHWRWTPSLLNPAHLHNILDASGDIRSELEEVTLEADPETIEAEKAAAWCGRDQPGQFWLQSFADKELIAAGGCTGGGYLPACRFCGRRDSNISFDLIAGLPHRRRKAGGNP